MGIAVLILVVAVWAFALGLVAGYSIAAKRAAAEHREAKERFDEIATEARDVAARLRELSG